MAKRGSSRIAVRIASPGIIRISQRSSVRADMSAAASSTTAARMKVETGRRMASTVSRSFQVPWSSTWPSSKNVEKIYGIALEQQHGAGGKTLQVGASGRDAEGVGRHIRKERQPFTLSMSPARTLSLRKVQRGNVAPFVRGDLMQIKSSGGLINARRRLIFASHRQDIDQLAAAWRQRANFLALTALGLIHIKPSASNLLVLTKRMRASVALRRTGGDRHDVTVSSKRPSKKRRRQRALAQHHRFHGCFAVWTIFSIIGVQIQQDLGLSETQFGLLIGTPILTGSLIRLVLGVWTEQYGGRVV
jgi:hypothetical protein